MKPEQVARAFSSHQFDEAYPYLAQDVRWVSVGESTVHGKEAVIEACHRTSAELTGVTTHFTRLLVIAGDGNAAAVDAVGEYTDGDGQRSVVASCDIYEFSDAKVTTITSYAVELPPAATA